MTGSPRRTGLASATALLGVTLAGLGLVGSSTATATAQDDDLVAAMAVVGIGPTLAADLLAGSSVDGTDDTFRFVAPGSRPATLDEGYVDIVRAGAAEAHWTSPPDVPCGMHDGALIVCAGDGPDLAEPHAVLWMQVDGDVPLSTELFASLAFGVLTDGGAPWVAQAPFLWDTFQGTDRWHDLSIRPETDWEIVVQRFTGEDVIVEQTDGFAIVRGDAVLMAVPLHELEPLAEGVGSHAAPPLDRGGRLPTGRPPTVTLVSASTGAGPQPFAHPWSWGASVHLHDGTLGSSPSDTSGIDSHPDTDTDTPRGPDQLAAPTSPPVVVEGAGPGSSTGDPTADADGAGDDGKSAVPIGAILAGVVALAGLGVVLVRTRRRPT